MKKDELIQQMAMKKKKEMEAAKKGQLYGTGSTGPSYNANFGGFVGVRNLTANSPTTHRKNWTPQPKRKVEYDTILLNESDQFPFNLDQ